MSSPERRGPLHRLSFFWLMIWAAIPLVRFPEIFFGGYELGHPDQFAFSYDVKTFIYGWWRRGEFTWFYPHNLLGASTLAGPQYQILYPLHFLYVLIEAEIASKILMLFEYVFLGLGFFQFFRVLQVEKTAAGCAASVIVGSSLVWSMHLRPLELSSLVWVPWCAYLLQLASRKQWWPFASLSGVCIWLSYIAGNPWLAMASLLFSWCCVNGSGQRLRPALLLSQLVVAGLLVAPSWYANALALPFTDRFVGFALAEQHWYSSHPLRLLEVFFPWWIAPISHPDFPWASARGTVFPSSWYFSLGMGCLGAAVWMAGLVLWRHKFSKIVWALMCLVAITTAYLSCGRTLTGGSWLWSTVPPLIWIRFPERLLICAALFLTPGLGYGFEWLFLFLKQRLSARQAELAAAAMALLVIFESQSAPVSANLRLTADHLLPEGLEFLGPSSRVLLCKDSLVQIRAGYPLSPSHDPRAWGIATVNGADAFVSPMLKALDCDWGATATWLGHTHILSPFFEREIWPAIEAKAKLRLRYAHRENNLMVWERDPLATERGIVTTNVAVAKFFISIQSRGLEHPILNIGTHLQEMVAGKMFVDPEWVLDGFGRPQRSHVPEAWPASPCDLAALQPLPLHLNATKTTIRFQYPHNCGALVMLPYAFIPGWRATVDGSPQPLYRINEAVMGLRLGRPSAVQLEFHPL